MFQLKQYSQRSALVGAVILSMLTTEAMAQLEEIVVTAERRESNVQDVPISINAFDSGMIEKQRIQDFNDLAIAIPGFSINSFQKSRLNPALRGGSSSLAAAGSEGAVGLFIDDQYFGGPGDFEIDLFDVERIEVLRGPQGTLFGRNTTGGSINVVTRTPDAEFGGKVEVTYGNYSLVQVKGLLNAPITDNLFGLISFASTSRDGTSFNTVTGNDIDNIGKSSIRAKLRYEPSDDFNATISASFTKHDETGIARDHRFLSDPVTTSGLVALGFQPDNDPRTVQQFSDGGYLSDQATVGLRLEKTFDSGQLLSIGSYRYLDTNHNEASLAGVPIPIFAVGEPRRVNAIQEELRWVSDLDGPINFVAGVFLYHAEEDRTVNFTTTWDPDTVGGSFQAITFCPTQTGADFDNFTITPSCRGNGLVTVGNQTVTLDSLYQTSSAQVLESVDTTSYAAFTEFTWDVTDNFSILAGGRYTYDEKSARGSTEGAPDFFWNPVPGLQIADEEDWSEFTYRFGATWNVNDDVLIYGTSSKGFRAGAYELTQSDPALAGRPVDPEIVFSHEVGIKTRFFNDHLQANIAYFDATYEDLQFFVNTGSASITTNAGEATVDGFELDLVAALSDNFTARVQWSHQNGSSTEIPADAEIAEGTAPQGTVPDTYIVALDYDTELANGGNLSFGIDWTKKDRYGLEFNDVPQFQSEVDGLVNARVNYSFGENQAWDLSLWGKNLTDEDIVIYGQDFWFAFYDTASFTANPAVIDQTSQPRYAPPLTFGLSLKYTF